MGSLEYTNAATDQGRAASKADRTKHRISFAIPVQSVSSKSATDALIMQYCSGFEVIESDFKIIGVYAITSPCLSTF
jgi:hypothetical protein